MAAAVPFTTRTTPLGAIAWGNQVRIYGQAESGDIREIVTDISMEDSTPEEMQTRMLNAMIPSSGALLDTRKLNDHSWRAGKAHAAGVPGTAIAPVQSDDGKHIRIYFQTPDLTLGELCNDNLDDNWYMGEYKTDVVMPGTSIAVLPDPSMPPFGYHIFFQGKDGGIWMSSRGQGWQTPRKILDVAMNQTALSVINWNKGNDARLYYQDPSGSIQELCRGENRYGPWTAGTFTTTAKSLADFCVVCREWPDIRLYLQEPNNDIVEWRLLVGWVKTDFRLPALPGTDITAVLYQPGVDPLLVGWKVPPTQKLTLLYFVGPDKIVHEKVQYFREGQKWGMVVDGSWGDTKYVSTALESGDFAGSHTGTQFSDWEARVAEKQIKRVRINSGWWLDAIALEFTDGSTTGHRGGDGGAADVFELNEGEDIVQVLVRGADMIGTLQFITSSGRKSRQYGGATEGRLQIWEYQGQPLAGFNGTSDKYIKSLKPLWISAATRPPRIGSTVLQNLVNEADQISSQDKENISKQIDQFNASILKFESDLTSTIKGPCDAAVNDVAQLGNIVKDLDAATGSSKRDLISNAKAASVKVAEGFKSVGVIAQQNLMDIDKQTTDIVYWEGQAGLKIDQVKDMILIAQTTSQAADLLKEIRQKTLELSLKDLETAQAAQDKAKEELHEKSTAKSWRDNLTGGFITGGFGTGGFGTGGFGLGVGGVSFGNVFDVGGLNSAIEIQRDIIQTAKANEKAARASLDQAEKDLAASTRDLQTFKDLQGKLDGLTTALQGQKSTLDSQRLKTLDISKTAQDIAVFVGSLTATSAPLEGIRTAADLAKAIQKLEDLIKTDAKLSGPFITNPDVMDDGLKAIIAAADVPPAELPVV